MKATETKTSSQNIWITLAIIALSLFCLVVFALGVMAHSKGLLSNLIGLALMLGFLPLLALRLPFAITKNMDWGFWKHPFAANYKARWGHIIARIAFWCLALFTFKIASAKYLLDAEMMLMLNVILYFGFVVALIASLIPKRIGNWPMTALSVTGSLCLAFVLMRSLMPSLNNGEIITVGSPITGESLMSHAGNDTLVNYHYAHSSQRHALDIVVLQDNGREYMGKVKEEDPCFGHNLLAPVAGEVAIVVKDLIDQEIGGRDPKNPAGNHVVIKMDGTHYALSAHMKQNSATVEVGDEVTEGQIIGQCGNSGNTSKPHLHFQVQRYPDLFAKDGYTYPIRFKDVTRIRGGKSETGGALYFRRNDIMLAPE